MSRIAIKADGLGKCYRIYAAPRDRLKQFFLPAVRNALGLAEKRYAEDFWAVRDASFEIERGQAVAIIGRNGSGKSTLLQMICGTLAPTAGTVEVNGRVAALLELGAGFNPEFTGRENVYLAAAIYGLDNRRIDEKMRDILDFAEIGEFIDQPVKTYSSGMFVRLAFSVVMHVEPEILVVDEALSVGDAFFQVKCAAAIRGMLDRGVTLLFVSHDTHAVKSLCDKAILMENGSVVSYGSSSEVVEHYYSARVSKGNSPVSPPVDREAGREPVAEHLLGDASAFALQAQYQRVSNGNVRFLNVMLLGADGKSAPLIEFRQRVTLRMVVEVLDRVACVGLAYHIRDMKGVELVYSDTGIEGQRHLRDLEPGQIHVVDWTFEAALREGEYNFSAMASVPVDLPAGIVDVCDFVPFALQFRVVRGAALPIYAATCWANELTVRSSS